MDKRTNVGHRHETQPYLLTPILFCGECGNKMRGMTNRGRPRVGETERKAYRRYWCYNAPDCKCGSVSADYLDGLVCDYVNQLLGEDIREALTQRMMDYVSSRSQTIRKRRPRNTQELTRLRRRHDAIIQNMSSGVLDAETLSVLNGQLREIRTQMDVLRAENEVQDIQVDEKKVRSYFEAASQIDPKKDWQLAQRTILRFVERVTVSRTEVVIEPTMESWLKEEFPQLAKKTAPADENDTADGQRGGAHWKTAVQPLFSASVARGNVNIAQSLSKIVK